MNSDKENKKFYKGILLLKSRHALRVRRVIVEAQPHSSHVVKCRFYKRVKDLTDYKKESNHALKNFMVYRTQNYYNDHNLLNSILKPIDNHLIESQKTNEPLPKQITTTISFAQIAAVDDRLLKNVQIVYYEQSKVTPYLYSPLRLIRSRTSKLYLGPHNVELPPKPIYDVNDPPPVLREITSDEVSQFRDPFKTTETLLEGTRLEQEEQEIGPAKSVSQTALNNDFKYYINLAKFLRSPEHQQEGTAPMRTLHNNGLLLIRFGPNYWDCTVGPIGFQSDLSKIGLCQNNIGPITNYIRPDSDEKIKYCYVGPVSAPY